MTQSRSLPPRRKGKTLAPWTVVRREEVFAAAPWIRVERQRVRLPDGRVIDDYHRIALADCVIIYAETREGTVIVERQYKHGPESVGLSLPAGTLNEGEDPLEAAQRELLEETGFAAELWQALGSFTANGNYGCGKVHLLYAQRACKVVEPASGDLEEMEILEMRPSELLEAMKQGKVSLLGAAAAVALAYAHNRPKL